MLLEDSRVVARDRGGNDKRNFSRSCPLGWPQALFRLVGDREEAVYYLFALRSGSGSFHYLTFANIDR